MAVISRESLLKFKGRRYLEVSVDWIEPGATARIQSLTEAERQAIESAIDKGRSARTAVIVNALVDDSGNRLFCDDHYEFVDSLDTQAVAGLVAAIDKHVDAGGSRLEEALKEAAKN